MGSSTTLVDSGAGPARPPLLAGGLLVLGGLVDTLSAWAHTFGHPYVTETATGVVRVDITGWARLHLAIGVVVTLAGLLVATGRRGTLPFAVGCAALAILVDLLLLPYVPVRALLVMGLDGAAVRLLLRHRRGVAGRVSPAGRSDRSAPGPPPRPPTTPD